MTILSKLKVLDRKGRELSPEGRSKVLRLMRQKFPREKHGFENGFLVSRKRVRKSSSNPFSLNVRGL